MVLFYAGEDGDVSFAGLDVGERLGVVEPHLAVRESAEENFVEDDVEEVAVVVLELVEELFVGVVDQGVVSAAVVEDVGVVTAYLKF